ncbi:sn-glycerol-3-phosphate import ATP-binding protein UgpC [Ralstonia pseudosolanacearum]|uniref:Glycerol-3-phosphate transporter subunit ATP-binding component of ABC superfamily n=1 Tax=Ralstonia solanacearum TaxID=305 RepID=A0A0S4UAG0_RALSL|nr:sn-glycerol-3-phosphate import ATP-binding protein UgpC [Ralstonia pseudosolanacearum]KAF3462995.1 sn-glycerol-3-phosphate import ATP-binding protein UgpC [Ralstonia solanacearum]ASL75187.1 sn-glycerol-3-phosphate ABC transporter ATP-binding protein UgpC [Ralstonia pseudosolanacearum]AST86798.1 sn-glycerol-3-phosphate import ATP-binding protein UgpC [Ralstonia pseudosolanacearum]MCK4116263.1 sn-glycerol-3-phosphate import ATP-binding protein UgpC [Ralstonia pseudosolanacearum]MCK4126348.1 s
MAKLSLRNVQKHYAGLQVVHGIDMEIGDGEFIVIVGPSGCGKSTLLRMVAGLEAITGGEVWIGDRVVNELEPAERDIAMVFQNYALYPHMTVFDNMAYGLKIRGLPKSEILARVQQAAGILELGKLLERKPRQLSGGQRQRVAMGRAIVREPAVFLFDEPLSNLDAKLRVQMRLELKELHRRLRTTSLYVTHDQVEAMTLADRMMVLSGGRVEQIGTPLEVYARPASTFVAGFIGSPPMNLVPVSRHAGEGAQIRVDGAQAGDAPATLGHLPMGLHLPEHALMGLRPEHIEPCAADRAIAFVEVRLVESLGADAFAYGALAGHPVVVRLDPHASVKAGDRLPITASADHLHWFDPQTTRRIEALA